MYTTYVGTLRALLRFILIVGLLFGGLVDQRGRGNSDALARWLEAILISAILHNAHLAIGIDITIFALHLAGCQFRFDFEGTIGSLITIGIRPIFIVPD